MIPVPGRLDLRLAPAALTGWAVTAIGIVWPRSSVVALVFVVLAGAAGAMWWRARRDDILRIAVWCGDLPAGVDSGRAGQLMDGACHQRRTHRRLERSRAGQTQVALNIEVNGEKLTRQEIEFVERF